MTEDTGPIASRPTQAHSELQKMMTDEQLLAWGYGHGLDIRNRDQLLDALAVGFSIQLWRNTVLEDVHANNIDLWLGAAGRPPVGDPLVSAEPEEHFRTECERSDADVRVDAWDWDEGDSQPDGSVDEDRLQLVIDSAAGGFGIPDDVMLRANADTADTLRHMLDPSVPEAITDTGDAELGPCEIDDLPEFMWDLLAYFADEEREIQVGNAACSAYEIITPTYWEQYLTDVESKFARAVAFAPIIGVRRALWHTAVSAVSYAGEWYPSSQWQRALDRCRQLDSADPHLAWYRRPDRFDVGANAFWNTAARPYALTGLQAAWMLDSKLPDQIRAVRQDDAQALGQPTATFNPIMGLV